MHDELFRQHEPPPGGLRKLQQRLATHERRRARRRVQLAVAFALLLVTALAGLLWSLQTPTPKAEPQRAQRTLLRSDHPGLEQLGLAPDSDAGASIPASMRARRTLTRLPTSNPDVLLYLHTAQRP